MQSKLVTFWVQQLEAHNVNSEDCDKWPRSKNQTIGSWPLLPLYAPESWLNPWAHNSGVHVNIIHYMLVHLMNIIHLSLI